MPDEADRLFLSGHLQRIANEGLPRRVAFPEARNFPDANYASHDTSRVIIPLEGTKPIRDCEHGVDEEREFSQGDVLYVEPYGWTMPDWNRRHTFFSLVMYPTHLRCLWAECDGSNIPPVPVYWHTAKPLPSPAYHVVQALNQIARFDSYDGEAEELMQILLRSADHHLQSDQPLTEQHGKAYQTYQLVCDYLNQNAHLPISRGDAAVELGITASHLSRLLHEHGGTSFSQYLLKLRMDRATQLLTDRSMPVKEVAYHCGYRDDSYFIRAFSAYHGVSPGKWRLSVG